MKIKLIKSTFHKEKETKKGLTEFIMNSSKLSMGDECVKFENRFAKFHNYKFGVLVNSGSSANLLLIQALLIFWPVLNTGPVTPRIQMILPSSSGYRAHLLAPTRVILLRQPISVNYSNVLDLPFLLPILPVRPAAGWRRI